MNTTMLYIQTSVSECQSLNTYMLKLRYYKGFPRYTTACHVQWASSHPVMVSHSTELKWESFNLCWVRFYTFDAIGEVYKEVYVLVLILGTNHHAWSHGLQRVLNWVQTLERRACWSQMQNRGSGQEHPRFAICVHSHCLREDWFRYLFYCRAEPWAPGCFSIWKDNSVLILVLEPS